MRITYSQGLLYISVADIQIALLQCHIPHVDFFIIFGKYFYHICLHLYNLFKPLYVWLNELTWLTFYICSTGVLIMRLLFYPDIFFKYKIFKANPFCTCNWQEINIKTVSYILLFNDMPHMLELQPFTLVTLFWPINVIKSRHYFFYLTDFSHWPCNYFI